MKWSSTPLSTPHSNAALYIEWGASSFDCRNSQLCTQQEIPGLPKRAVPGTEWTCNAPPSSTVSYPDCEPMVFWLCTVRRSVIFPFDEIDHEYLGLAPSPVLSFHLTVYLMDCCKDGSGNRCACGPRSRRSRTDMRVMH